ncbi:MAG: hypothetical protein ACRDJX_04650 [Solirubrobacteraceae bacterium]
MISGGGAPSASLMRPLTVTGVPTPFGVEGYQLTPEEEGGAPDRGAGSHPFQLTTTLVLNQTAEPFKAPALVKDLRVKLPPGLVGDATPLPQCTDLEFTEGPAVGVNLCPSNTAVGVASVTIDQPNLYGLITLPVPVFNLTPARGEPARFGFDALNVPVILDTAVRTGGDYGVTVNVDNVVQNATLLSSRVTLWGVPGSSLHDQSRGYTCLADGGWIPFGGPENESCVGGPQQAFLTLPTSCAAPLTSTVEARSWVPEAAFLPPLESPSPETLEGCGELPFSPSINVEPEGQAASTPAGLNVEVKVPQSTTLEAEALAEADVKDTRVALPEGLQLSPAAAGGLLTCSTAQVGFEGGEERAQTDNHEFSPAASSCPEAAKVGTVKIKTPLLANELEGALYLAAQDTNPFQAPLVLYLIAQDPVSGVLVKLAGKVTPDPITGQLTSTFEDTPQLPFEDLQLHFFGGPRASLSTPSACGTYTTTSSFTPWSDGASRSPSSNFQISSGPGGSPCASPQPFAPSFTAQTTNVQAGAFTPFTLQIAHPDADQALRALTMHLPPGVAALLSSVTPCGEPQAAEGTCGAESEIGHSTASSGLGSSPYTLPGQVYLTGPYKGAPFGLAVVTPAVAGPFNLGSVIVRARINVDPYTAAVTITSDPFPTMLKGVPTQLKAINVTVDRLGFTFNPTDCNPMSISGTLTGAQGASAAVSTPFQVANCATLPFKPKLTALTQAKTSKVNGAYLHVKVTSGPGQANIAKTTLAFPKVLPSRLTTLQKACLAAVFEANPASCPEGSVIGTATVHTPVLKSPLAGPAYLVSHGGAAFPDVEFVLQGEGITVILDGQTDIKKGITSSTFNAVPDVPFTSFDAILPEGPHSIFAAYGSLCSTRTVTVRRLVALRRHGHLVRRHGRVVHVRKTSKRLVFEPLAMPTTITGQNGAVIKQTTKIAVEGCHMVKSYKAKKSKKRKKGDARRK